MPVRLILTCLCAVLCGFIQAQNTIVFEYDPSGNRILRDTTSQTSRYAEETEEPDSLLQEEGIVAVLYPNPNDGLFILRLNNYEGSFQVNVFNTQGRMVYTHQSNGNQFEADLRRLSNGVYFVQWRTADRTSLLKLIKNW